MRLYQLGKLGSFDGLKLVEVKDDPKPGASQVRVRIRACSLNHRDLNIISGTYTSLALKPEAIPLSDGAGEITAVGQGVTRWKIGDRVAPSSCSVGWVASCGPNICPRRWAVRVTVCSPSR